MRVLSKNTVSPTPTASRTDTDKRTHAVVEIAVTPTRPSVTTSQARTSTAPTADRAAFSVTELNDEDSVRTSRPMRAQLRAQPVAHSAPHADSERKSTVRSVGGGGVTARLREAAAAHDAHEIAHRGEAHHGVVALFVADRGRGAAVVVA